MIRKPGILSFIVFAALGGLADFAAAQTASPDMVYVTVTVTGPKKAAVPDLKTENFQLFEDGVEQKITSFSGRDGVWDFNIILASSQLLPGRADRISAAIRDAVETFKSSGNPANKTRVEELKFGSDGLYAAIDSNLEDLQRSINPRRGLLIITDGFDRPYNSGGAVSDVSNHVGGDPANVLVDYSKRLNIPIYFFYTLRDTVDSSGNTIVGRSSIASLNNSELSDKESLTNVADQTGGHLDTVDPLHQLEAQCKLLAEELRNKYVLGFKSTNDKKDDKWRSLKLKLIPPAGQKLDFSMKKKYFVSKPVK
jgi:Ca-activated chloride channel family protein